MAKNEGPAQALRLISGIVAIPYNFFVGFVLGLAAPVAVMAAMVFGVRFLTGKMPFLRLSGEEEPDRRLMLDLVEQDQAQTLFEAEKDRIMTDLRSFTEEMKALIEESKARGEAEEG